MLRTSLPTWRSAMTFRRGVSGNPHGNRHHTRHLLNQRFLQALLLDFEAHGREAIEECRKQSPLGYVKVLGHLVPRESKIEHSQSLKSMSDQEFAATSVADGARTTSWQKIRRRLSQQRRISHGRDRNGAEGDQ